VLVNGAEEFFDLENDEFGVYLADDSGCGEVLFA
jgi:hypothetical protein